MTKGKRPHKFVLISCPHCGSSEVAFDQTAEIVPTRPTVPNRMPSKKNT